MPIKRHGVKRIYERKRPRVILRIPNINKQPNKRIAKKENENRGRYSKKKCQAQVKKDIDAGLRLSNTNGYIVDSCFNCGVSSEDYMVYNPESELVCTCCGAVQPEKYFEGAMEGSQKISSSYQTRTYICERIRAFGNVEPRIAREDIKFIGQVYSELESFFCKHLDEEKNNPEKQSSVSNIAYTILKIWFCEHPADISKYFIKNLLEYCDMIREKYPTIRRINGIPKEDHVKFKTKYLERWLQIKVFLCGEIYYKNNVCSIPDEELLRDMYLLCMEVLTVYDKFRIEARLNIVKKSIIKTDLLFLIILYNLSPVYISDYSWYFANENMIKKPEAYSNDYSNLQKIIHFLNSPHYPNRKKDQILSLLYFDSWKIPDTYNQFIKECLPPAPL